MGARERDTREKESEIQGRERERKSEIQGRERERETDSGERERGKKKKITNTKKFMEFYLVVLQSCYHFIAHILKCFLVFDLIKYSSDLVISGK